VKQFIALIAVIAFAVAGVRMCQHVSQENTVFVEAFFSGEKNISNETELANTFSYLMTGSLGISNAPKIDVSDIDQEKLRQILKPEFWARQGQK